MGGLNPDILEEKVFGVVVGLRSIEGWNGLSLLLLAVLGVSRSYCCIMLDGCETCLTYGFLIEGRETWELFIRGNMS